ncbi:MAG: SAM-dependent methyltransferase [Gammaproteobacteria bacterium]|nr:SAM-dependent methyltransferase [Gammaproteobacteria bacterium]
MHRLPVPDDESLAHSRRTAEYIRAAMKAGALSFAEFMALALYAPGLGYYSAGLRKFGEQGDFVTAPEISPLFGRCLARQCRDVLAELDGGQILEFGAGSGMMAADILTELETLDCLPEKYFILEVSADLRQRQQAALAARAPHLLQQTVVVWLDNLPEHPLRGVIIANEVLDAMPVHRFQLDNGGLFELFVTCEQAGFAWQAEIAQDARLIAAVERLRLSPEGAYVSEINLELAAWIQTVSERLAAGLVLLIDYGFPHGEYYHPQRDQGTLMCHYRHHAHTDPLIFPGIQDITAHVNFTAVAEAAADIGLHVAGFTAQADFLLAAGLEEILTNSDPGRIKEHLTLVQQAKRLIMPGEMGELFKAIALTRDLDTPLRGFVQDRRGRL